MEKVRPWCGQSSDQWRLKNRTEEQNSLLAGNSDKLIHCVSKKQDTILLHITSPNVNRFFHW